MDIRVNDNDVAKEESRCFVCDAQVRGRYYTLATCRTQNSQARVIEKLGELVGERYMVVISEDDVICRSCAVLVNNLDRLETEMRNVRNHVLRFLERKYFLEDGELRGNSDRPKPCQPPQITKSNAREVTNCCARQSEIDLETYYSKNKQIRKRSHSWLQCDKCKYTTHLNSFMMHHLRDHVKQKTSCDVRCELCVNQEETVHHCADTNKSSNKENERDNSDTLARNDSMEASSIEKRMQSVLLPAQTPPPAMSLASNDHVYISSILPARGIQRDQILCKRRKQSPEVKVEDRR
ncbi:uncharacterized protein LOC105274492 isoform X2 [Ooceraea biroi]|uniref:uncharacterized protein LOC105274492 isoform X2 n=1 Tax=Ooceraea biroi TaxID=2015173 RepID=UPI0005B97467|nr:uncharacterized protein LOC105274492 isoform X2 [Ooceraea biroi]